MARLWGHTDTNFYHILRHQSRCHAWGREGEYGVDYTPYVLWVLLTDRPIRRIVRMGRMYEGNLVQRWRLAGGTYMRWRYPILRRMVTYLQRIENGLV